MQVVVSNPQIKISSDGAYCIYPPKFNSATTIPAAVANLPGMIDWLSLSIDVSFLSEGVRKICYENHDRIQKINRHGEILFEKISSEWLRSDSNYLEVSFGAMLHLRGSPARVVNCNNVFGSLDIKECALTMIKFFCTMNGVIIPQDLSLWNCTRIDVTRNYDMGSLQGVLDAIDAFKLVKVGRQKICTEDTTCSWGRGSSMHCGTAYAKGPQSRKLFAKSKANFTPDQLRIADRLLRLEYSIRNLMLRRLKQAGLKWQEFTPEFLIQHHTEYFNQFISNVEVVDMGNTLDLLLKQVALGNIPTEAQAKSAYDCYLRCREKGYQQGKASYPKGTFSRHMKNLSTIGVGPADLQPSNVVPLRRRQVVLDQPVSCWDDIKLEAQG